MNMKYINKSDSSRLLNEERIAEIDQIRIKVDRMTLGVFTQLTHDDTGRYSGDGGIRYNELGLEKQELICRASNMIDTAMEILRRV